MKAASVKDIKHELKHKGSDELIELCLRLAKFKAENKELLTYLLFESDNESHYINTVKDEIDTQFEQINTKTYYFIKKSIRKILRHTKKHIRYSKHKETEVELLLHFCMKMTQVTPSIYNNTVLKNIFNRELAQITKKTHLLHDDLQHDYSQQIKRLLQKKP
ncbi:MAG: hypothetical protein ACPGU9_07410 [Flavobacteriaceae bacterium]